MDIHPTIADMLTCDIGNYFFLYNLVGPRIFIISLEFLF